MKGLYHVNAVDKVTQGEAVGAAAHISDASLMPVLEAMSNRGLDSGAQTRPNEPLFRGMHWARSQDRNRMEAERHYRKAIELAPNLGAPVN